MRIQDVVIHTNEGLFQGPGVRIESIPPPAPLFQLATDLWLGKLDDEIAERVLDSCEPAGYGNEKPVRQFGQLYAYVREPAPAEPLYVWDSDSRLLTSVALSRLVHPTLISFHYAARILYDSDGTVSRIIPGEVRGAAAEAWVAIEGHRDWLNPTEREELKQLVARLPLSHLPPRVWRAFWYHEYSARTRYVDVKWTLISTALEALVHTERSRSTAQFTVRVPAVAGELTGCNFSKADAEIAYEFRSRLSHGQGLGELDDNARRVYQRMEAVLRRVVVRAILEAEFAQVFAAEDGIRSRWPLPS
ncbi:MAG: hypothetical protein HYT81_04935 [Gemmatimonadetes bacterium]|nr:hypothetical protein [Gemmatimonadota bacterium]